MNKEHLVIIGNGMAGMRTVEELLNLNSDRYHITVIGAEPYGNYNRIMLSPVLAGDKLFEDIITHTPSWYMERGITLIAGQLAQHVDRKRRMVRTDRGLLVPYDRLVLATGSLSFKIPIPGHDHPDVISFRGIQDVHRLQQQAARSQHIAVIGGGLLGLEAAHGLRRQCAKVTVVHNANYLMNRQLDAEAALQLQIQLEKNGLGFRLKASTTSINLGDNGKIHALLFADGSQLHCDMVVMAVGILPHIELARRMGIQCDRGILVNDTMQTFDPRIYAVGECVQHRGSLFGLVAPLYDQARVCANHLAGMGYSRFLPRATATTLKVNGIDLYSAGDFSAPDSESIYFRDLKAGIYKRLVIRNNRLIGAVLFGDTRDGPDYFAWIRDVLPLGAARHRLIFGATA